MQPTYILQPLTSSAAAIAEIEVPAAGRIKVGRDATNDVALPHDLRMSSAHFELFAEAGGCRACDLGSTNGLFLNSKRVANVLLVEGDELQAGESRWRVVVRNAPRAPTLSSATPDLGSSLGTTRPPGIYASSKSSGGLLGSSAQVGSEPPSDLRLVTNRNESRCFNASQVATIGRTDLADWIFEYDGQMSSLHAEIFAYGGTWRVKDLDSSNGTFLNEVRISEGRLNAGDELRCGTTRFVVSLLPQHSAPPVSQTGSRRWPSGSAKKSSPQLPPLSGSRLQTPPLDIRGSNHRPQPRTTLATAYLKRLSDGREFELPLGQTVELGRGQGLPISLPDDLEISTRHATLQFDGHSVQLRDIGSSNGTFVAGERITTCQLVNGQRFRAGQTDFLICTALPACDPGPASGPLTTTGQADDAYRRAPVELPPVDELLRTSEYLAAPPIPNRHYQSSSSDNKEAVYRMLDAMSSPARPTPLEPHAAPSSSPPALPITAQPTTELPSAGLTNTELPDTELPNTELPSIELPTMGLSSSELPNTEMPGTELPSTELPSERCAIQVDAVQSLPAQEPPANAPLREEESPPMPTGEAICWEDATAFAKQADDLRPATCRSGLVVYRGISSGLDPVDVGLRVLQSTTGWVLNGGDIENWMEAARQGLKGQPREWLSPAQADDASWMLPFLSTWGSGKAWLVFSSVDLDDVLRNILRLRPIDQDAPPLMPALTPLALATFLSESDPQAIARFFQPLDALLVEITAGQTWALFSRPQLPLNLQQQC